MIVRRIALNGWRNYAFATAEFSPGTMKLQSSP